MAPFLITFSDSHNNVMEGNSLTSPKPFLHTIAQSPKEEYTQVSNHPFN